MNKRLLIVSIATLVALPTFALRSGAAVIDSVQDKVNAIKRDTNAIKDRTAKIVSKADEQIRETVDIKGALEPLFTMRDRLVEMGIDPAEFLEMIPVDEIRDKIEELRLQGLEVRDAMNDPNLEAYRSELLDTLAGMNGLLSENEVVEVSPLQTLVENAPHKALAILKLSTETIFVDLKDLVTSQVANFDQLRDLGVFGSNPLVDPAASWTSPGRSSTPDHRLVSNSGRMLLVSDGRGLEIACSLWGGAIEVPVLAITTYQLRNIRLISMLDTLEQKLSDKEKEVPVQIHGYVGLRIGVGEKAGLSVALTKAKLERQQEYLNVVKDYIKFLASTGVCDAAQAIAAPAAY